MTTLDTLRRQLADRGPYRAVASGSGETWRVEGAAGRYVTSSYPTEEQAIRVAIERISAAERSGWSPAWRFAT